MKNINGECKIEAFMSYGDYLDDWKELGIENCRFYDLRGSYATKSLRNGVEIREVADILGHSKIEATENYYISTTEKTLREASEKLKRP